LEVNGGPSMTANTKEDSDLKVGLIDDVMTINNVEGMYLFSHLVSKEINKSWEDLTSSTKERKSD
jgi:hypothetical protein